MAPPVVHDVLRTAGQPIDAAARRAMEARIGHDFRSARVHSDTKAAASASAVGARAYTVGRHIVFGEGQYAPHTHAGRWLLTHELVHVAQQRSGATASGELRIVPDDAPSEAEARTMAADIAFAGGHATTPARLPTALQRQPSATQPQSEEYSEDCSRHLGSCEFYRCRQRNTGDPRGAGYYLDYGYKYCQRFSDLTHDRRLSPAGRDWLGKTLLCLQQFVHEHVAYDAPPEAVKKAAFDSHPDCYVLSGVCFLSPGDWEVIWETIDWADNDLKQILVTAIFCGGNYLPMAFPIHSLAAGGGYGGLMERDWHRNFGRRGAQRPFPPPRYEDGR
jgi:hypothetical protein